MDDYNLPHDMLQAKFSRTFSTHYKPVGAYLKCKKWREWGWNKQKTHPYFADGKRWYSIHAEMDSILQSHRDLKGSEIWVYREIKGVPAMAKPCKFCMKHLIEVGVKRVYFTINHYPWVEKLEI
jgi:deoxycytidylate deaminase